MSELGERHWRELETADDVTSDIEEAVAEVVDGWFQDGPMSTEDFIDQLCKTYGGSGYGPDDWDITSYDNEAVRKIMRQARKIKREAGG